MLSTNKILKILQSYNMTSTGFGPTIYQNDNKTGICLEVKDKTFGFLTRLFTFENSEELELFLNKYLWFKNNNQKYNISLTLDNYETKFPEIFYTYQNKVLEFNDMQNFEERKEESDALEIENIEKENIYLDLENLNNYLIELLTTKNTIRHRKNDLKIKENDLKFELLEQLTIYYGKNKTLQKKPVNLEIISQSNDSEELLNKKNRLRNSSLIEIEKYLKELVERIKNEELEEKYLINIYSNQVYEYNIDILNKQIDFVKRKIEAEKNFNLKGSKIHNIDAELKSFLKTNLAPVNIKDFLTENKNKILKKYENIKDIKDAYYNISGKTIDRPVIKKEQKILKVNALEDLKEQFDKLDDIKKAQLIIYNSFYKNILNKIKNKTIDEIKENNEIIELYHELESVAFNEVNNHYLANYFKYINFKTIETYINSLLEISKTIENTNMELTNSLNVFGNINSEKEIISIDPIYNKKETIYLITIPEKANVLYIPDKISIDKDTKEMSIISTKNIYLKNSIQDTNNTITVNKYHKKIEKDKKTNLVITKDLKLKDSYKFNLGIIEGE